MVQLLAGSELNKTQKQQEDHYITLLLLFRAKYVVLLSTTAGLHRLVAWYHTPLGWDGFRLKGGEMSSKRDLICTWKCFRQTYNSSVDNQSGIWWIWVTSQSCAVFNILTLNSHNIESCWLNSLLLHSLLTDMNWEKFYFLPLHFRQEIIYFKPGLSAANRASFQTLI